MYTQEQERIKARTIAAINSAREVLKAAREGKTTQREAFNARQSITSALIISDAANISRDEYIGLYEDCYE
tara:strand:+ start:683 stop:895 length:213 start_codon:yes stop_codon:yes gene_type:complete